MSINIDVHYCVANDLPLVFWRNRINPFIVGSMTSASSGKTAIVKADTSDNIGKPMIVEFRLARKPVLASWEALVNSDPFNTTSLASYFNTGYKVIFSNRDAIREQNELLSDYDLDQNIFTAGGSYQKGFNYFRGVLNLIITDTV